jgi:hypothetical protein
MQTIVEGFMSWLDVQSTRTHSARTVDTAITVVATLLIATTWAVLHH